VRVVGLEQRVRFAWARFRIVLYALHPRNEGARGALARLGGRTLCGCATSATTPTPGSDAEMFERYERISARGVSRWYGCWLPLRRHGSPATTANAR
jgi:hypothetical protein